MSVNSSTYSLATLVLGGGALLLAIVYLWTVAPAELANTEYSQYYRADNTGTTHIYSLSGLSGLTPLCFRFPQTVRRHRPPVPGLRCYQDLLQAQ